MKITACEIGSKEKEILKRMVKEEGCDFIDACNEYCPLYNLCPANIDELSTGDVPSHLLSIAKVVK